MMIDKAGFIEYLRAELTRLSTEENKLTAQRFFKHSIQVYGVRAAQVEQLGKEAFKEIKHLPKMEIFEIAVELWKSGMMEESFIACRFSISLKNQFEKSDMKIFKGWIEQYIDNWASCDTFCNHTIGEMLMKFPELRTEVISWSKFNHTWMKRASAVSYIVPARKGLFLEDVFTVADTLLMDKEDMVQKGYGWALKVASQSYLEEVFSFVMERKDFMPRTALRYAIEKMPADYKNLAMAKS